MDRRRMIGSLAPLMAVGLTAVQGLAQPLLEGGRNHHRATGGQQHCAAACFDCARACREGLDRHQSGSGGKAYARVADLCRDCIAVCSLSGDLIVRASPLTVHACLACAECCRDCIRELKKIDAGEAERLIQSLRLCSASCYDLARVLGCPGAYGMSEAGG